MHHDQRKHDTTRDYTHMHSFDVYRFLLSPYIDFVRFWNESKYIRLDNSMRGEHLIGMKEMAKKNWSLAHKWDPKMKMKLPQLWSFNDK